MELTRKQEESLKIALERYRKKEPYTLVLGYAGTGKTTLIKFVISALGLSNDQVKYIAYTGKAVSVLKEHGCHNSCTMHRFIYKSFPKNDGTFRHIPKTRAEIDPWVKLIVVDEISMIPVKMWEQLLSYRIHVIALGDPGQLPPVGSDNSEILKSPHIFLDEVMRQAKESEIIRFSMDVREGKSLELYQGSEVRVISPSDLSFGLIKWGDQMIAGTNRMRQFLNEQARQAYGINSPTLTSGEKVICLKNNWDIISVEGEPLVNGYIGKVDNVRVVKDKYFKEKYLFKVSSEDDYFSALYADKKLLDTGEPTVTNENFKLFPPLAKRMLQQFDYAYCITCWKSQGSEYNKVVFFVEPHFPRDAETYRKYLYTGITRAKEKIVIVKY